MDLGQLSYTKRNKYLLWGSLAFAILAYLLAIQNTIDLAKENVELKSKLQEAEQAPMQVRQLQNKLQLFNARLGNYLVTENDNQEKIVRGANAFCQASGLILREIPELTMQEENDFEVITTQVVAQGSFINLLKLVHHFEKHHQIGRVSSVKFLKAEDFKTRKTYLSARIYLQNIKLIKE
jgi:hypothetical protein